MTSDARGSNKSGVIEALRAATRPLHAALGASPAMARLFDPDYTIAEYRTHLGRLLGLFEPLESAVAGRTDPRYSLGRSDALRKDLRIMGATDSEIDSLDRSREIPVIEPAGLYGYLYVVLGSMLGGKIIVKRLRSVLGPAASVHFYGGGNGYSEALWRSFCHDLETQENPGAICATAVAVFDAYAAWLPEPPLPGVL
jgi:heme oxygenase